MICKAVIHILPPAILSSCELCQTYGFSFQESFYMFLVGDHCYMFLFSHRVLKIYLVFNTY